MTSRQAAALYYRHNGLTFEEIAAKLGTSRQAAHRLHERGTLALKVCVARGLDTPGKVGMAYLDLTEQQAAWVAGRVGEALARVSRKANG